MGRPREEDNEGEEVSGGSLQGSWAPCFSCLRLSPLALQNNNRPIDAVPSRLLDLPQGAAPSRTKRAKTSDEPSPTEGEAEGSEAVSSEKPSADSKRKVQEMEEEQEGEAAGEEAAKTAPPPQQPEVEEPEVEEPKTRRGRGRPRKQTQEEETAAEPVKATRGRGRSRKNDPEPQEDDQQEEEGKQDVLEPQEQEEVLEPKPRGGRRTKNPPMSKGSSAATEAAPDQPRRSSRRLAKAG